MVSVSELLELLLFKYIIIVFCLCYVFVLFSPFPPTYFEPLSGHVNQYRIEFNSIIIIFPSTVRFMLVQTFQPYFDCVTSCQYSLCVYRVVLYVALCFVVMLTNFSAVVLFSIYSISISSIP